MPPFQWRRAARSGHGSHEAAKHGAPFIRKLLIVVVTASAIRYLFFKSISASIDAQ
jgi:hypothetical protein